MPTRVLREGILDSERVCSLSFPAEVFYRRLMSVVDDFGRFDARTSVLRSRLYPLQIEKVREADIERWIAECVKAGLIALYSVSCKQYILFPNLGSPRAKESKFPAPPDGLEASMHMRADVYRRAQMNTDASGCMQTRADVPGSGTSSNSSAGSSASGVPPNLATPEFQAAWEEWQDYRRERRLSMADRTMKSQLKMLSGLGSAAAVAAIESSIRNGYQGLFPEKSNANRVGPVGGGRDLRGDEPAVDPDKYAGKFGPAPGQTAGAVEGNAADPPAGDPSGAAEHPTF